MSILYLNRPMLNDRCVFHVSILSVDSPVQLANVINCGWFVRRHVFWTINWTFFYRRGPVKGCSID